MFRYSFVFTAAAIAIMISSGNAQESSSQSIGKDKNSRVEFLERLMEFDSNHDEKIGKDELPSRMHKNFDRWDQDGDGFFDQIEMNKMATVVDDQNDRGANDRMNRRRGGGQGAGQGRDVRGPGFPGGDGRGRLRGQGRRSRPMGPPTAEEAVERAMEFDADGNGELNASELHAAFQDFLDQMPPPPGMGGRGPDGMDSSGASGGGFGRGQSRGSRGGRPPRMQRPEFDR